MSSTATRMALSAAELENIAQQWRDARRLYPIYAALEQQFQYGLGSCKELDSPINRAEPDVIAAVWKWFDEMDARIQANQLRQVLQNTSLATRENLQTLIHRALHRENRADNERDKLDFLLAQYFTHCAPKEFYDRAVEFADVAQVLEPVLGLVVADVPDWAGRLEAILSELEQCDTLRDMHEKGILAESRKIKLEAGQRYFAEPALIAFTRFNFLVKRSFFRLLAREIEHIRGLYQRLDAAGLRTFNGSAAELSSQEPLTTVRDVCLEWRKGLHANLGVVNRNYEELIRLRGALESALETAEEEGKRQAQEEARRFAEEERRAQEAAEAEAARIAEEVRAAEAAAVVQAAADAKAARRAAAKAEVEAEIAREKEAAAKRLQELEAKKQPAAKPVTSQPMVRSKPVEAPKPAIKAPSVSWPTPKKYQVAKAAAHFMSASANELVDTYVMQIAEQLFATQGKSAAAANIEVNGSKHMLSSWETGAFVQGGDDASDTLQRVVAVRTLLQERVERFKRGEESDVKQALALARVEAALAQELIAQAKDVSNVDVAVNLSATAKRLSAVMEEAEQLVG